MIGLVEAPRAFWLAHGMARTRGVHLAQAVVHGWLTRSELRRMVGNCQTCPSVDACEQWLGKPGKAAGLPEFCTIAPEIAALSGGQD